MVTIDYHSLITDGGFIVTRDGDKIEGYAEMTSAATGKKLRIYGTCTYDQQDAERTSFISLNDLKTPLEAPITNRSKRKRFPKSISRRPAPSWER